MFVEKKVVHDFLHKKVTRMRNVFVQRKIVHDKVYIPPPTKKKKKKFEIEHFNDDETKLP